MDSGMMMHKLEELHLTQLNLILLNNFYKQIYEGKAKIRVILYLLITTLIFLICPNIFTTRVSPGSHEASVDQLNCGACSEVFPVSRMSAYLQHKALHLAGVLTNTEKPLGSPTISGSDQTVPTQTDNKGITWVPF